MHQREQRWVKRYANNIARIATVAAFLLLAIWAITLENNNLVIGYSGLALWCTTALVNVGPELAGIVIGIVTIDYLNERRQEEQLKKQLILQLGSGHNDVTDTALRALRAYGWLYDGTLIGADLSGANLENAELGRANLKSASLLGADLEYVDLSGANLENTVLAGANLEHASLMLANLGNAFLFSAYLKNASLRGANLENARNWTEEQLLQARSLEGAIMPDGTKLKDTDGPLREPYDGPTLDEWLAMQKDQVDEQALAEVDALLAAEQGFEEE